MVWAILESPVARIGIPMTRRRLPRPGEILPLIGRPDRSKTRLQRRLERCGSVWDVRQLAKRRTPNAVFDYTDGGAMSETSLGRSRAAYRRVEFTPRVLRDVSDVDTSVDILGQRSALPFVLAPTGFTRLMNHVGEPAVAAAAARYSVPYALSTLGTTSIEDLASASRRRDAGSSCMSRATGRAPKTSCNVRKHMASTR